MACFSARVNAASKDRDTIDVGANIGMFSMYCASKVDGDITLFSFEPMPKIHDLCNENLKRFVASKGGRVTCLQKGVSSEPGDAVFDFHKNFSLWSTARPEFNDRRNDRLVRDLPAMTRGFKESGRMSWFFNTKKIECSLTLAMKERNSNECSMSGTRRKLAPQHFDKSEGRRQGRGPGP